MAQFLGGRPVVPLRDPVREYDRAEQEAIARFPNRIIECVQPITFQAVGYPARVNSVSELWRYADVMQEGRVPNAFEVLGGLTQHEFELFKSVSEEVIDVTGRLGHTIVPGAALMRALLAYRAIKADHPRGGHILEFGPGSGYVSMLLLANGFSVSTVDVTQAF